MVALSKIIQISVKAARAAGEVIRASEPSGITIKSPSDYITETDVKCQDMIKNIILQEFPDHNFLAEEDGGSFEPKNDLWIIDPLDGTTNFIHGLKHSAVSIGFYTEGDIQAGVIYDPYSDELFHAFKGGGSFLNGSKLNISSCKEIKQCLMATGMPFRKPSKREKYFICLSEILASSSGIRRMGSAALDLAYVAAGRFDGFFEGWLSPWDMAAGVVIAKEAGAAISDFRGDGDFLNNGCIICAQPAIFGDMFKIINKHLKDEQ
ncbi:MAG: inositol monophosphatase [Candidatus Delongbacteria bacterium]|nr:inositol monophosphatase [Candidatus Delongbacteria bacterium]